jgi:hypothetical protein
MRAACPVVFASLDHRLLAEIPSGYPERAAFSRIARNRTIARPLKPALR